MGAVGLWAVHDLRRRWPRLVAVALLVALVCGTAAASFAGARRGATAADRLEQETAGLNALIPVNPGVEYAWTAFDDLPYVEARGGMAGMAGVSSPGLDGTDWLTTPGDDEFFFDLERPVVFDGRIYDPETPDELFVSPTFARENGVDVGDTIDVRLPTPRQAVRAIRAQSEVEDPAGPWIEWTVVGIGLSFWLGDEAISPRGKAAVSPATLTTHADNLLGEATLDEVTVISVFRLEDPARDVPRLVADAKRLTGETDVDVWNVVEKYLAPARSGTLFEARMLAVFGLVALLAGAFVVGSAIARSSATAAGDLSAGPAIGMTPHQVATAASLPVVAGGLVGAFAGAVAAAVASRWFPIGTAAAMEPAPGIDVDLLVLPAVFLLTVGFAALVAYAAARRAAVRHVVVARPMSRVAGLLANVSAPVPVTMGARFALEPARGRNDVPTRPAQIGAIAGVAGIVAALVFGDGIDDALDNPRRFGQVQQVEIFTGYDGQSFADVDAVREQVADLSYVDGVLDARQGNATAAGGQVALILYSANEGPEALAPVVTDGQAPDGPDEVLLAPRTADSLDAEIGSVVPVDGSRATRDLVVTGIGFVPPGAHNGYADGGWVTESTYDTLFDDFHFRTLLVHSGGLSDAELTEQLSADLDADRTGLVPAPPPANEAVEQLRSVRRFPLALAGFLGLLAIGVVGNAVLLAVRRRRGELAVVRALGMTGRQAATAVAVQSLFLVGIGLALGVPLGLAVGRTLWRSVASYVPLEYVAPASLVAVLWVSLAGAVLGLLLAALPARRAARAHLATILRAE